MVSTIAFRISGVGAERPFDSIGITRNSFQFTGFFCSNHSYPAIIIALADKITSRFDGSVRKFQQLGVELQQELETAMGPNGIILHPPYIRPAPRHHVPFLSPFAPAYTAIFNVMEFPVTQVPIRLSKKGLPIGVQVVGSRGCDGLTLAVGEALETDFGGWIPALADK